MAAPKQRDWRALPACPTLAAGMSTCPHELATTLPPRPWAMADGRMVLYATRQCAHCGQVYDKPVRARLF